MNLPHLDAMDLCAKLQMALLHHEVSLKPVPPQHHPHKALQGYDASRLQFIQDFLDQDDDEFNDEQQSQQVLSSKLLRELTDIVASYPPLPATLAFPDPPLACQACPFDLDELLLSCAKAVAANNPERAYKLVEEITRLTLPMETSLQRTALYFANALVARIRGYGAQMYRIMAKEATNRQNLAVEMNLPVLRATEFFANQTIFEACRGAKHIHIVDYGIFYGCQWPSLIKALSERAEGPPRKLMITGVERSSIAQSAIHQTGKKLISYAKSCGIALEFQPVVSDAWEKAEPRYNLSSDETLVINCKLRMKHLSEEGLERPRRVFFRNIARLRPAIFVQCVVNMDQSSPFFIHRFECAWKDLHARMEQIEETMKVIDPSKLDYLNKFIEKNIMNIVACEGTDRVERSATYKTWNHLATRAGFEKLAISEEALRIVKAVWTSHEKFTYGIDDKWLLLGWKDVILTGMSAWQPASLRHRDISRIL